MCAHIDSAFEGIDIEGANDNASGVAILMKLVLKLANIKNLNRKIKCVFYNGEEIIEIDVVGDGKVMNIFTNEKATSILPFLSHFKSKEIEKVIIHNGGERIFYILAILEYEARFHLLQLSDMLHLIHTPNDNKLSID